MGRVKDQLFRTCTVCGKEFMSRHTDITLVMQDNFCSHKCSGEWQDVMEGIGSMQDQMLDAQLRAERERTGS